MSLKSYVITGALLAVSLALLGYGAATSFPAEASLEVSALPWGLLVPGYVFFASIATGSVIVLSVYSVFGYHANGALKHYFKYMVWLSLITLVPAWILILFDLTQPAHIMCMALGFQPASRVAWMAALYVLLALALLAQLVLAIRGADLERTAIKTAVAVIALAAAVAVDTNLGQVFGSAAAVPGWYGAHQSLYFTASAILAGISAQSLTLTIIALSRNEQEQVKALTRFYSKSMLIVIPVLALITAWIAITAWYHGETWQLYGELLFGADAPMFWCAEVAVGLAIPLILAVIAYQRGSPTAILAASVLALIGCFASKYDLIVAGQLARLEVEGVKTLIGAGYLLAHYTPSAFEVALLAGALVLWPTLIMLGNLVLPLAPEERPRRLLIFK